MIRKTLPNSKAATFAVQLPNQRLSGMPYSSGTGFFVSADGWFVTAAHVITENGQANGPIRKDSDKWILMKEDHSMCQYISLEHTDPRTDFALLKVDFAKNSNKEWLKNKNHFPYIEISLRQLEDGEPVYSFGYPLPPEPIIQKQPSFIVGFSGLCPRVTSAIVSSNLKETKMIMTLADEKIYVLDKALNYGNSGGPIIAAETGRVHAICSHFQPVFIPQNHLIVLQGAPQGIFMPSLYGIVSSLANDSITKVFKEKGVPFQKS